MRTVHAIVGSVAGQRADITDVSAGGPRTPCTVAAVTELIRVRLRMPRVQQPAPPHLPPPVRQPGIDVAPRAKQRDVAPRSQRGVER